MRVAYVYELDAQDVTVQSGFPHFILKQLHGRASSVVRAFPLDLGTTRRFLWKKICYRSIGRIYRADREPTVLANLAHQAMQKISNAGVDCVLAPGSHSVAQLDVKCPKIFCADATFHNMLDFYDDFSGCAEEYLRQGDEQERLALSTSAAAIYPSKWAADTAIAHYGADPARVHVVPFGAGVDAPSFDTVTATVGRRPKRSMNVLFIGKDWRRKDLPKVVKACRAIAAKGVEVSLDVVGVEGYRCDRPAFARFHGFLNKSVDGDRRRIERLLSEAHFLFVPSRAEAYGEVFCEAAAFGTPAVTTDVGGIPTIVLDGITGISVPSDTSADEYAEMMLNLFADRGRYEAMAIRSYEEYRTRLNWDTFGERVMQIMRQARDIA
jgi:glycosyltransferase involved in cell wall biosynthesis